MAIRPDYQTGTIDLVASSADFTTTGAALQMVAVQPGDAIITPSGHVLIIATITGQNSGTLFLPCPPDAAGTGLALRIRFQPDGSRYQGAVRNLIDLLSSGNLEAFAAIVGAAGLVPIFTGVGTMDLADPATFGIQDPNGSLGKLAALTLAASKFLNTNGAGDLVQSDIATWAISMISLAGSAGKFPYLNGANTAALATLTDLGRAFLALTGTNGNIPVMTGAGTAASRPIVGTVSQSGGIPTGAIIEASASTAAGYMRLAGGVQICWRVTNSLPTGQENLGYIVGGTQYDLGQFAAAFIAQPAVIVGGTGSTGGGWMAQNLFGNTAQWGSFSPRHHVTIGPNVQIYGVAIGRHY